MNCNLFFSAIFLICTSVCVAQTQSNLPSAGVGPDRTVTSVDVEGRKSTDSPLSDYILGPYDQVNVFVTDLEEFNNKAFRIDGQGNVNLPLAGRIHAAGLTTSSLSQQIAEHLIKVIKNPDVVVSVTEFHSQPIFILGAVGSPGERQIEGGKTLFQVISLAGGLRADAGNTITLTRDRKWGAIPLENAKNDTSGRFSVASISVKPVLNAKSPEQNIVIMPGDIISVSQSAVVYAVGSVVKPGGFSVGQNDNLTALQVLSLAEGLQKTAAGDRALILRSIAGSSERSQIALDVKKIMLGKAGDVPLQPDDILFVPDSKSKAIGYRSIDALVNLATGMAVYGRY
jgi:polysaccharide biosynthesis/export protein